MVDPILLPAANVVFLTSDFKKIKAIVPSIARFGCDKVKLKAF
jgi:hypothetical protein